MKRIMPAVAAMLMVGACSAIASPDANSDSAKAQVRIDQEMAQNRAEARQSVYNPNAPVYPDESRIVIGGQAFYFNRYIPFGLR